MREFSYGGAWTSGLRFFAGRGVLHLVVLLGIGILLPLVLQLMLLGEVAVFSAAPGLAEGSAEPTEDETVMAGLVTAAGNVFQLGSLFASWRLGFDRGTGLGRALAFGLGTGLAFGIALLLVFALFGFAFASLSPIAGFVAGGLAGLIFLCAVFALPTAMVAAGICLLLGVAMIFGAATGNLGLAATLVGGSGFLVVLLLILSGLFTWLAGRLSCTIPLMYERRSFNLWAAAAESWRMTWEDEWRIMRYLGLLAILTALTVAVAIFLLGGALAATSQMPPVSRQIVPALFQISIPLPIAFLTVLVPAGIHRELVGTTVPAELFA